MVDLLVVKVGPILPEGEFKTLPGATNGCGSSECLVQWKFRAGLGRRIKRETGASSEKLFCKLLTLEG
jgi:hypothetical protein